MPSIRQPSPAMHIGVVVDEVVAEARRSGCARPAPCRPRWRCPGRAGRWSSRCRRHGRTSGWPGGLAAELAEALELVDRHVLVAGQMEQRIEQHRAVAGRQHEAVAVGPVRVGGDRTSGTCVNSTVATSAMPIGMPGWPEFACFTASMAEHADGVGQLLVRDAGRACRGHGGGGRRRHG